MPIPSYREMDYNKMSSEPVFSLMESVMKCILFLSSFAPVCVLAVDEFNAANVIIYTSMDKISVCSSEVCSELCNTHFPLTEKNGFFHMNAH